jgi:transaldolase
MILHESLKEYTIVVADTSDIEAIAKHRPQDASTNASLLSPATQMPTYRHFVDECAAIAEGVQH